LYEIIPVGIENEFSKIDELKYQKAKTVSSGSISDELMTVKFRYKKPNEDLSKLIVHPVIDNNINLSKTSDDFRWSAAVAASGMIFRDSEYIKGFTMNDVLQLAQGARGIDKEGYRIEFINMMKTQSLVATR
jgi:Ca-activated chloride channel family protein